MKRICLALLIILSLSVTGCTKQTQPLPEDPSNPDPIVKAEDRAVIDDSDLIRGDIDMLYADLKETHKGLYDNISEMALDAEFELLKGRADHLNQTEIKLELMRIFEKIGDAHTVYSTYDEFMGTWLPVKFTFIDDALYCINASSEYEALLFKEVVGINGIHISVITSELAQLIPAENEYWKEHNVMGLLRLPDILHALGIIDETTRVTFEYIDENGLNSIDVASKELAIEQMADYLKKGRINNIVSLLDGENTDPYWYEYDETNKILVIHYDQCYEMEDYTFSEFNEDVWKFISDHTVDKLVIDLRYNTGGRSNIFDTFRYALVKNGEYNDPEKLFVLIGNRTFSSGTATASMLKRLTNATLVGEPTGGAPNSYGNYRDYYLIELPNLGGAVVCTDTYFEFYPGLRDNTLAPDVLVDLELEDYKIGRDRCMEYIKGDVSVKTPVLDSREKNELIVLINKWHSDLYSMRYSKTLPTLLSACLADPTINDLLDEHDFGSTFNAESVNEIKSWALFNIEHTQNLSAFNNEPSYDPWGEKYGSPTFKKLLPSEMKAMNMFSSEEYTGKCGTIANLLYSILHKLGMKSDEGVIIDLGYHAIGLFKVEDKIFITDNQYIRELDDERIERISKYHCRGFHNDQVVFRGDFKISEDLLRSDEPIATGIIRENNIPEDQLVYYDKTDGRVDYTMHSLNVDHPEVYLEASIKGPLATKLSRELTNEKAILSWIKEQVTGDHVLATEDSIQTADQTIVFKSGNSRDKGLLALSLLRLNRIDSKLLITEADSYLITDDIVYSMNTFERSKMRATPILWTLK